MFLLNFYPAKLKKSPDQSGGEFRRILRLKGRKGKFDTGLVSLSLTRYRIGPSTMQELRYMHIIKLFRDVHSISLTVEMKSFLDIS